MTDTKFKYNDHIIIKYGFYRGMSGKVQNRWTTKKLFSELKITYMVKTDVGNLEVFVNEDQIEIVGRK